MTERQLRGQREVVLHDPRRAVAPDRVPVRRPVGELRFDDGAGICGVDERRQGQLALMHGEHDDLGIVCVQPAGWIQELLPILAVAAFVEADHQTRGSRGQLDQRRQMRRGEASEERAANLLALFIGGKPRQQLCRRLPAAIVVSGLNDREHATQGFFDVSLIGVRSRKLDQDPAVRLVSHGFLVGRNRASDVSLLPQAITVLLDLERDVPRAHSSPPAFSMSSKRYIDGSMRNATRLWPKATAC